MKIKMKKIKKLKLKNKKNQNVINKNARFEPWRQQKDRCLISNNK